MKLVIVPLQAENVLTVTVLGFGLVSEEDRFMTAASGSQLS